MDPSAESRAEEHLSLHEEGGGEEEESWIEADAQTVGATDLREHRRVP